MGLLRSGGAAFPVCRMVWRAAGGYCRLQLRKLGFQVFVGHDQRLDGAAQVAVAHCDRLVAGLLVVADVGEDGGCGHGWNFPIGCPLCSLFVLKESRGAPAGFSGTNCLERALTVRLYRLPPPSRPQSASNGLGPFFRPEAWLWMSGTSCRVRETCRRPAACRGHLRR